MGVWLTDDGGEYRGVQHVDHVLVLEQEQHGVGVGARGDDDDEERRAHVVHDLNARNTHV